MLTVAINSTIRAAVKELFRDGAEFVAQIVMAFGLTKPAYQI